jgi:formyltetrahydrofolate hydrolase
MQLNNVRYAAFGLTHTRRACHRTCTSIGSDNALLAESSCTSAASRQQYNSLNIAPIASSATPPESPSTASSPPKRLAVFVSGGGSNFRAIHAAITDGRINADVAVVVTNAPSCGGAAYASSHSIPVLMAPRPNSPSGVLGPQELATALIDEHRVDFVILAGACILWTFLISFYFYFFSHTQS